MYFYDVYSELKMSEDEIKDKIKAALKDLSSEAVLLYLGQSVPIDHQPPDPLYFYREFVSQNRPLVIKGGVSHWPALEKWTNEHLCDKLGQCQVTVTATPNGYADAPLGELFMMPEERQMTMEEFVQHIENPSPDQVYYIQKQNSNLTDEFRNIIEDVDDEIHWASEAFGKTPDAINFWMGDERAVTSSK